MDLDRLLERILSAAPLAVLLYLARRQESERVRLLEMLNRDREAFRDERRELINRVIAPQLIPTGTRPGAAAAAPRDANGTAAQRTRAARSLVGHAAPPLAPMTEPPTDDDDVA